MMKGLIGKGEFPFSNGRGIQSRTEFNVTSICESCGWVFINLSNEVSFRLFDFSQGTQV